LGRPFVQVDTVAMANLVAGRKIVPELMQDDFTPAAVAEQALRLLQNPAEADRMRRDLRHVRAKLGPPGASLRAAEAVLRVAATKSQ
jgi:lipid-A-disaccharide synthase